MDLLIDTHAHLDDEKFADDLEDVLVRAKAAGVGQIITVGIDLPTSRRAVELAKAYRGVFAAIGVHPHEADSATETVFSELKELAGEDKVIAWGEIGLDYYYDNSPREIQREVFARQLRVANELGLPVIMHSRDAHADTVAILRDTPPDSGVMHCFSGSLEMARELADIPLYYGAGGPITFRNAKRPVEVFSRLPLELVLLETDCPYLAPVPHRGKRNEPAFVRETARKLAELKDVELIEVMRRTTENARKLFSLPEDELLTG